MNSVNGYKDWTKQARFRPPTAAFPLVNFIFHKLFTREGLGYARDWSKDKLENRTSHLECNCSLILTVNNVRKLIRGSLLLLPSFFLSKYLDQRIPEPLGTGLRSVSHFF